MSFKISICFCIAMAFQFACDDPNHNEGAVPVFADDATSLIPDFGTPDSDLSDSTFCPIVEAFCDGQDDDCDGIVDEGFFLAVEYPGVCGVVEFTCDADGDVHVPTADDLLVLRPELFEAFETRCDGLDNDCDGAVDEWNPLLHDVVGVCIRAHGYCENGRAREPTSEEYEEQLGVIYEAEEIRCDGLDNDCDGVVDEQPLADEAYRRGVCSEARRVCEGAFNVRQPTPADYANQNIPNYGLDGAACDGFDNDCDGVVDEIPREQCGLDETVITLYPALCRAGFLWCYEGSVQCFGAVVPVPEECEGPIDDDCDGLVNEGCYNGACREDADCPFDAECDLNIHGGTCTYVCGCQVCEDCLRVLPAEQCDEQCTRCANRQLNCEAQDLFCMSDPEHPDNNDYCVPSCFVNDDCREGFRCRIANGRGGCFPE